MDDLDREIEEAARIARRRVWQGRLATIASTGALLVIGIGWTITMYQLFPDREEREFDVVRRENAARNGEDPSAAAIAQSMASELSANRRDQSSQRWRHAAKYVPREAARRWAYIANFATYLPIIAVLVALAVSSRLHSP